MTVHLYRADATLAEGTRDLRDLIPDDTEYRVASEHLSDLGRWWLSADYFVTPVRSVSGYTKLWHRAKIGETTPALCGKKPPGGRAWKVSPENSRPPCPKCAEIMEAVKAAQVQAGMWLAS